MSYLTRLKALQSETPLPHYPSKPSKALFEGFEGDVGGWVARNDVAFAPVPAGSTSGEETTPAVALARLAASPPSGVSALAWSTRLTAAAAFAAAWGERARAQGWSEAELYGLHPLAPMTRLDAMGAAFLTAGKTVVEVTADAVALDVPPSGLRQRARKPTLPAPPAWETWP